MSESYAVEVTELTKKFGEFAAVDRVSFRIQEGEVFGFLGPNGSGKTTTIRMLCGILSPTAGKGMVLGMDISREAERLKEHIGYMSQRFSLYNDLTVWENLNFYASVYRIPPERKRARIEELIGMADLVGQGNELTANLSGAWKQRLALGCAIIHHPPILFLDEPTAGVDPVSRRNFWDMIYQLAGEGVTVFVTTHYMDEAEHCNTIGLMHQGKLIACDTPDHLKASAIQGRLLAIDCSPLMKAMDILADCPAVREVVLYGTSLHVVVSPDATPQQLSTWFGESGITVTRLEPILPSLDDVFISLMRT
ncbi:MAG: ABC transporter ATP-binding protein [Chloroflexi bacterium]|nr:ABC transporter ATP-binding protein [Chloroflexota bacterium]MCL5075345.1 ABC transporter ATP-binding protein [Chloroflexota bacterium]